MVADRRGVDNCSLAGSWCDGRAGGVADEELGEGGVVTSRRQ